MSTVSQVLLAMFGLDALCSPAPRRLWQGSTYKEKMTLLTSKCVDKDCEVCFTVLAKQDKDLSTDARMR